jgi:hypothetical protein
MNSELGSQDCLARYRALHTERPDCFSEPANSPIAILTDVVDIEAAQAEEGARCTVTGGRDHP